MPGMHLPGGPVGPPARWAATSNVEVGQTTYPVDRGRVESREGENLDSHKCKEREGGVERGRSPRPLTREGRVVYLDICAWVPEFIVIYAAADGADLPY